MENNHSGTRGIWNNLDKNLSIFGRIQPDYCIRAIWIKKEEDGRILSIILSVLMQQYDRRGRRSLPPGTLRPQSPNRRRRDPKTGTVYNFAEWKSSRGTSYSEDDVIDHWNHVLELPAYPPNARFRTHGSDASCYIQGPSVDKRIDRWVNQKPDETKLGSDGPIKRSEFGYRHRDSGTLSFRDILLVWDLLPPD